MKEPRIWTWDREADAAQGLAEGRPICIGCGWSCDDPELDLCCDCADETFMRQLLRGDYGRAEQRDARRSKRSFHIEEHST